MSCFSRGLAAFLALFLAFTGYVLSQTGVMGFVHAATANLATLQLSLDLVVSLSLVSVWLFRDARTRGVSPWPYLVATLFLGSAGPLAYLVVKSCGTSGSCCPVAKVVS